MEENWPEPNHIPSLFFLVASLFFIQSLFFMFGSHVEPAKATFVCDSGTLDDTCVVSSSKTLTNGETISGAGSLVIASGGILTIAAGSNFNINMTGDVTIQSGGSITGNSTITAANFTIDSGGSVNVSSKGYTANTGTGTGVSYGGGGGGAGYGGVGGGGWNGSTAAGGGSTYGSAMTPTDLGSGGANGGAQVGGTGGGAIKITATGITTINGAMSANGGSGVSLGGHGSGGSIWITTGTLAGAATISANGASGASNGGGGGGGRIALYYTTRTHNGSVTTTAGTGYGNGAAGSIIEAYGASYNNLTLSSGSADLTGTYSNVTVGASTVATVPSGASLTADVLNINSSAVFNNQGTLNNNTSFGITGARYTQTATATINALTSQLTFVSGTVTWDIASTTVSAPTFASTTISSGVTLTHTAGTSAHTYSIILSSLGDMNIIGNINVDLKGYVAQSGPGAGAAGTPNGGGGGSNGGAGGTGYLGALGGSAYGSFLSPVDLGSGGGVGNNAGGVGGGAVKLTSNGVATVSGSITAGGGAGLSTGGYGAGGSIWITAGTLIGSGTISANGASSGSNGGGGGGGRIALYYTNRTHNGSVTANGGTSSSGTAGGTGTVVELYGSNYNSFKISSGTLNLSSSYSNLILTGSNSVATIQSGDTLSADVLNINSNAVLNNQGTLNNNTSFSIAGARYTQIATSTINALTSALTFVSGTVTWDIASSTVSVPTFASTTVSSGVTLTHTAGTSVHTYSLILSSLGDMNIIGNINVDAKGYSSGNGPGAGVSGSNDGGGGSYGGVGGTSFQSSAGGPVNGSISAPISLGSAGGIGGGSWAGGAGGGAVKLTVTGTTTISGSISAAGGSGVSLGGYGSGGSIWITSGRLSGSGTVSANGASTGSNGGGGAGGRIALYYTTRTYNGSVTVTGGTSSGGTAGAIGTKYPPVLYVTTQPSSASYNTAQTITVGITFKDLSGATISTTTAVSLGISNNPNSGTLSGTLTVNAVAGVATFSGLGINKAGTGYTLIATSTNGTISTTTNAFNITAGTVHHYTISATTTAQTVDTGWTETVTAMDQYENATTTTTNVRLTNSGDALFYTNSSYTTATSTYVLISGSVIIYVKDSTAQTLTITATSTGLTGTSNSIVISALPVIASAPVVVVVPVPANGAVVTVPITYLPGYKPPREQIVYPDGKVVYLEEKKTETKNASVDTTQTIDRTLSSGSTGLDVKKLQRFLNVNGYVISSDGPGSLGNETDYFGPATKAALAKFQKEKRVTEPTGELDSVTKVFIEDIRANTKYTEPDIPQKQEEPKITQTFNRDLDLKSKGDDVILLQEFLIKQNSGPASKALSESGTSGYFGTLTQSALAEFQKKNGLTPSIGYFGQKTRELIQKMGDN